MTLTLVESIDKVIQPYSPAHGGIMKDKVDAFIPLLKNHLCDKSFTTTTKQDREQIDLILKYAVEGLFEIKLEEEGGQLCRLPIDNLARSVASTLNDFILNRKIENMGKRHVPANFKH